jgi:tRNA threonylcarbamoyladenosine biosynthesis protein TsaB
MTLALDTTTPAGSVALVDGDGRVIDERRGDGSRTHAARLPAEILAVLDACGVTVADVDLFAVASGPGSFTGLRIGIATIQGLAFVQRRQVAGISALEALAQIASATRAPGEIVAAWMDAHRREVFSALYRVAAGAPFTPDRLVEIEAPAVGDPAATLVRWAEGGGPSVFIGDGAVLYGDMIRASLAHAAIIDPPPLAGAIGRLAIVQARAGDTVDPAGLRPLYVRRPDAEIALGRKKLNTEDTKDTKEKT